jgi:hypothetical protein
MVIKLLIKQKKKFHKQNKNKIISNPINQVLKLKDKNKHKKTVLKQKNKNNNNLRIINNLINKDK